MDEIKAAVKTVEADMGKVFGDAANPLLFSVRSGAAVGGAGVLFWLCVCQPPAVPGMRFGAAVGGDADMLP